MKLQIFDTQEPGFHPVLVAGTWKAAIFNDAPQWRAENISYLQKHLLTDEVFVLLEGACTLLLSDEEIPETICRVKMEPGKVYNVPKGVWHSHILEKHTKVLVVENSDTTVENSPKVPLPEEK